MNTTSSSFDKKRYRATVRMAARFGIELWWLNKTRVFRSKEAQRTRRSELYTRQAQTFRKTAGEMGGLLIKLGQHLSTHIEVMPKEYVDELSKLQDAVPPVPTHAIVGVIEKEFERPLDQIYSSFSEVPIAAASLGQVHRATTVDGDKDVAVKVLRPNIENLIATDLESLHTVLRMLKRFSVVSNYMDIERFYKEFETTISQELDLNRERASADTFREMFTGDTRVHVPKTYWAYTTERVLTLEFEEGVKINELEKLDEKGIDRTKLAQTLIQIYLKMILTEGFFHADPHPGNVLVRDDGTIVLLDFGMVGTVPEEMQQDFIDFAMALFLKDTTQAAAVLQRLGFLRSGIDTSAFEKSLSTFMNQASRMGSPTQAGEMSGPPRSGISEDTLDELGDFMRSQPFQLPDNVTFLIKAVTTVIGLCSALDPKIDLIEEVKDSSSSLLGSGVTGAVFSSVLDQLKDLLPQLLPAVKSLPSVVTKLDRGDISVKLSKPQEKRIIERGQAQSKTVVRTIVGAALFIAGVMFLGTSYTHIEHHEIISYVLMGLGLLIMLMQTMKKTGKRRRRAPHPTPRR